MATPSLITRLERDAKLIRVLLLVRDSLDRIQGAQVRLPGATRPFVLDNLHERRAIDASLRLLGVEPNERDRPGPP